MSHMICRIYKEETQNFKIFIESISSHLTDKGKYYVLKEPSLNISKTLITKAFDLQIMNTLLILECKVGDIIHVDKYGARLLANDFQKASPGEIILV